MYVPLFYYLYYLALNTHTHLIFFAAFLHALLYPRKDGGPTTSVICSYVVIGRIMSGHNQIQFPEFTSLTNVVETNISMFPYQQCLIKNFSVTFIVDILDFPFYNFKGIINT